MELLLELKTDLNLAGYAARTDQGSAEEMGGNSQKPTCNLLERLRDRKNFANVYVRF